jgi:hypothetical protein
MGTMQVQVVKHYIFALMETRDCAMDLYESKLKQLK